MKIDLTTNAYELAGDLGAIPAMFAKRIVPTLERIGATLERDVATTKITAGGILEPRTGNLRRALFHRVQGQGTTASVIVGADLSKAPYGRVQELGGTIVPRRAAHLAIPLDAMLTAKGVARMTAREVIANPFALGFSGTFTAKGVIFGKLPDQIVPLFALKSSVTLPARQYLASTLAGRTDWIEQQFAELAFEAWQRGGGDAR